MLKCIFINIKPIIDNIFTFWNCSYLLKDRKQRSYYFNILLPIVLLLISS